MQHALHGQQSHEPDACAHSLRPREPNRVSFRSGRTDGWMYGWILRPPWSSFCRMFARRMWTLSDLTQSVDRVKNADESIGRLKKL